MTGPRLVATVGLHGSASTGVFNIARELMIAAVGEANVLGVYGEDIASLPAPLAVEHRHIVLKSHSGSPALQWLFWMSRAPVLLSIRDPRDAVLSMMGRFKMPSAQAVQTVAADCRNAIRLMEAGHEPLRYEDRFFDNETLAPRLAARLGLDLPDAVCRQIGARYSMAGVRSIASNLSALPAARVVKTDQIHFDQVTQVHRTHIGDGVSGKWRDRLSPQDGEAITQAFRPFLMRLGYALA